jgi:hypothetical protein
VDGAEDFISDCDYRIYEGKVVDEEWKRIE